MTTFMSSHKHGWRHHCSRRDYWTFVAGVEGTIQITQASWRTELHPGDRVILPAGRAFDCEVFTRTATFFTGDFRVLPAHSHSDPLLQIGLPVTVPGSNPALLHETVRQQSASNVLRARARFEDCLLDYLADGFSAGLLPLRPLRPVADWLMATRIYLVVNFMNPLDLDSLADHIGFSRAHLSHEFRRAFGITPIEFLYAERLHNAARLLTIDPGATIAEVARRCGFPDQAHFTRRFRRRHKLTPTQWRQRARSAAQSWS
jgi:AraC-like DNA-binding protein